MTIGHKISEAREDALKEGIEIGIDKGIGIGVDKGRKEMNKPKRFVRLFYRIKKQQTGKFSLLSVLPA